MWSFFCEEVVPMAELTSLNILLRQKIKDLYDAETQLVKALPEMAKAASDLTLRETFEAHLEETKVHGERLEQVALLLGTTAEGKVCKAVRGLVEEGAETIKEEGDAVVKDLALITAAQNVEHYEISGYGSARALADALGLVDAVEHLQTTLDEEGATDKSLTRLAAAMIPTAPADETK